MKKSVVPKAQAGYGTFNGVFLPTILSIFGVVMFLRLGWMVGHIGMIPTALVIVLSIVVATMTALSISATVSNMRVGGGGAYFIISRSLGIEAGTAIGLLLYLAQSLGIAFFLVGFAESVIAIFPKVGPTQIVALPMLVFLSTVAFSSSSLMVKLQIPIALAIATGLVSFFVGNQTVLTFSGTEVAQGSPKLWDAFAVFFPAVTGIISGIGLSGQLRDPSRSLPRGMLAGIAVAAVLFLAIPIFLYLRVPAEILRQDTMVMARVAAWEPLLILALWSAALSSAIAALLAAPRTLQALALDQVLPRWLSRGFRRNDKEPRIAMTFTMLIAFLGILLGDLNAIAPILSTVFLTAFVTLNFSAGVESLIKSPSWRPTFKTPTAISLGGALLALVIMIMIDAGSGLVALTITGFIYYLMLKRNMKTHWGDARQGIMMLIARYAIQRLQEFRYDPYSWKPHFLVMTGSLSKHRHILNLVECLNQDTGFITVATIVPPETTPKRAQEIEKAMLRFLHDDHLIALARIIPEKSWEIGCIDLLKHYGLGQLVPDTVVIGIPSQDKSCQAVALVLEAAAKRHCNVVLLRLTPSADPSLTKETLVWWGGKRNNGSLMIAFGHLLQVSQAWGPSTLKLKSIALHENQRSETEQRIKDFASRANLDASWEVIDFNPSADPLSTILEKSQDAGMVFVGLKTPEVPDEGNTDYATYLTSIVEKTRALPNLGLVMAADEVRLARLFR